MAAHARRSRGAAQRQLAILRSALAQVAPGGRLIYSTCSLEKEENEDVVEQALSENKSFRLLDCRTELDRLKDSGDLTWPDPAVAHPRSLPSHHPRHPPLRRLLRRNLGKNLGNARRFIRAARWRSGARFYRTSKFTAAPASTFCPAAGTCDTIMLAGEGCAGVTGCTGGAAGGDAAFDAAPLAASPHPRSPASPHSHSPA